MDPRLRRADVEQNFGDQVRVHPDSFVYTFLRLFTVLLLKIIFFAIDNVLYFFYVINFIFHS